VCEILPSRIGHLPELQRSGYDLKKALNPKKARRVIPLMKK
jgi:hypothetical protein